MLGGRRELLKNLKNNQIPTRLVKIFVCIVVSLAAAVAFFSVIHILHTGLSPIEFMPLPMRHWVLFAIAMVITIISIYCLVFRLPFVKHIFITLRQFVAASFEQLISFLKKLVKDNYIQAWYDSQPKSAKVGFCGAAIFALLTHFIVYSGQIWEGHFVGFAAHTNLYGGSSGRWFGNALNIVTFNYINWATGLFQVLFISLTVFILVKAFNIKSRLNALLISGVITTFPAIAELNMFTSSIAVVSSAILLSAAGFYITKLYKFGWLPGAVLVMLGLATYQAKIGITMVASLIWLVIYVIKENPQPLHFIKYASRYALLIAGGLLSYSLSFQLLDVIQPFYRGMDDISVIGIPSEIPRVYWEVWNYFFSSDFRIESHILSFTYGFVGVLSLLSIGCLIRKHKGMRILNVAFIVFLTLLLPLAANFSRIFDTGYIQVMTMTSHAFSLLLLLPIILIDNFEINKIKLYGLQKALLTISLMFIIGYFISFSNFMYQNGKVITTYLYQFSNRLAVRVEPFLPYSNDNQVMVAGNLLLNPISPIKPIVPNQTIFQEYTSRYIYAKNNTFGGYNNPPYLGAFFPVVMRYLSGIDTSSPGNLERRQYLLDRAISDGMPVYPQEGSVALIDGTVVAMLNFYARLDVEETGSGSFVVTANHIGKSTDLEFMYSWYVYKDGQRLYQIYESSGVDHIEFTIGERGEAYQFFVNIYLSDGREILGVRSEYFDVMLP